MLRARTRQLLHSLRHNASLLRHGRGASPRVYLSGSLIGTHPIWATYRSHPPVRYVSYPFADVIHCFNAAPRLPHTPFVAEVEHLIAMARDVSNWPYSLKRVDQINEDVADERCRLVLTPSQGVIEHSKRYLRPELWHKLEPLYPAYPEQPEPAGHPHPFTLLTIASRWSDKGIPEVLRAFAILRDRFGRDVQLTLVLSEMPDAGTTLPEGTTVVLPPPISGRIARMPEETKAAIYGQADLLMLPCYSDTAACFPEAYAFGVPVVTTRIHHGDEYVRDGETGFLIDPPFYCYSDGYGVRWKTWDDFRADVSRARARGELDEVVDQLVELASRVILDPDLAARLRASARRFHRERFSLTVRNGRVRDIYARVTADLARR